jgi:hypothetical protein
MRVPWYVAFGVFAISYVAWAGLHRWDFLPDAFWIVVAIVLGSLYGGRAWLVKEIAKDEAEEAKEAELAGKADGPEADAPEESGDGAKAGGGGSAADDAPR